MWEWGVGVTEGVGAGGNADAGQYWWGAEVQEGCAGAGWLPCSCGLCGMYRHSCMCKHSCMGCTCPSDRRRSPHPHVCNPPSLSLFNASGPTAVDISLAPTLILILILILVLAITLTLTEPW